MPFEEALADARLCLCPMKHVRMQHHRDDVNHASLFILTRPSHLRYRHRRVQQACAQATVSGQVWTWESSEFIHANPPGAPQALTWTAVPTLFKHKSLPYHLIHWVFEAGPSSGLQMLNLLNPNELLAEDALVPATFRYGALGVAKGLDPGSTTADIAKGASLPTPLWLLVDLHRRGLVALDLPDVYKERYRRKLNAGAECVSLRNRAPFFYEVGIRTNCMLQDVELAMYLSKTFRIRYQELISKGLNTMTGEEVLELMSKLSTEEQQLFAGGRASIMATEKWLQNDHSASQFFRARKRPSAPLQEGGKLQRQ